MTVPTIPLSRAARLLAAALCFTAVAAAAQAQYSRYPYGYPPGSYRAPLIDDDDDLDDMAVPAPYGAPGRAAPERGASAYPYVGRPEPYDRRYDRPPPGVSDPYAERRSYPVPYGDRGLPERDYAVRPGADGAPVQRPPVEIGPSLRPPGDVAPGRGPAIASLPPEDQPEIGTAQELPPHLRRQVVAYPSKEPAGTIIIDTANTYLYLVLGQGQAVRYGIGVGREGFTWAGRERISRMAEWPDWHPPADMIERQPYLPRFMAGGESNPLGARALYLGKTLYRIHGTNQPSTIGKFVSSGCIRMLNEDVEDLYRRVTVGSEVVVLPGRAPAASAAR